MQYQEGNSQVVKGSASKNGHSCKVVEREQLLNVAMNGYEWSTKQTGITWPIINENCKGDIKASIQCEWSVIYHTRRLKSDIQKRNYTSCLSSKVVTEWSVQ